MNKDTIYALFSEAVAKYGGETAIIENTKRLTFRELSDLADRIVGTFPERVKRVGVVMNRRAEMIAAILAVLKCGAAYVPAEPSFPTGRIRYMMEEAAVDFILTERECADKLVGFDLRLTDCEICGAADAAERADVSRPESPAYVLYTSGTTGRPKGVCVTNGNVCHYARAFAHEFHPAAGDVMLQYSVCSFDIFVEEVFASLLNGAALAIPAEEDKADLDSLMRFVEKHRVTMISGFPYLFAEMNHRSAIPACLRLLISGGDVLRGAYVDNLLGKAEVYNTYGPSETTVCASYYRCNGGTVLADGTYPIGKAVQGAAIRIVDAQGREAPEGEVGEICISGDGVSLGYIGDHEEENKAFEKQADGSLLYRSGDLGYLLPDGNVAFLHRKDTQIMILGRRVEVSEVESCLYRCKGVRQALVRAYTDENGLSYMTAYVVPAESGVKISALRGELSERLAPFMIPEFFVKMPFIPLNANGKPDAAKLPVVLKEGNLL